MRSGAGACGLLENRFRWGASALEAGFLGGFAAMRGSSFAFLTGELLLSFFFSVVFNPISSAFAAWNSLLVHSVVPNHIALLFCDHSTSFQAFKHHVLSG